MSNQNDSADRGRRDTPLLSREPEGAPKFVAGDGVGEFDQGELIAGRFEILSLLGKGGMGFVYLVRDERTGNKYAMKTVSAMNASERTVQRFEIEAKATSLIKHPNVVQFHYFGLVDGRQPYFVMDYCHGDTLADVIKLEGALPVERTLDIFIPICSAVAYAHTQSVIHRDLKPSNIMIEKKASGLQVKVLDFGIAKILVDETAFNSITKTGELFGSPYYMSPEQCVGKSIDCRSDIYSLGCVLFETLTGSPPFLSDNPLTTMMKHQAGAPPTLKEASLGTEFPEDLEKIVAGMLAKNPDDRYQNLLLVEHDLRLLKRGERLEIGEQNPQLKRRFPVEVVAVGICALVVACVGTCVLLQPSQPPAQNHAQPNTANKTPSTGFDSYLPDLSDMSKSSKKTIVATFYSDAADAGAKTRRFHFPDKPIGNIGAGENEDTFFPAKGEMTLPVPFSFALGQDVGAISGFRPDEVNNLIMRGLLVDDISTRQFRHWREVQNLDLNWCDVSDRSIENIQTLPKLNSLHVSQTHISASGLSQLNLKQMHNLEANLIAYVTPILPKTKNDEFKSLRLRNAALKDSDMLDVARLHHLNVLDITGNYITDKGLGYLSNLQDLDQFWFSGNNVTPKCMEALKKIPHLHGVTLTMKNWSASDRASFEATAKKLHFSVHVMEREPVKSESDL